MDFVIIFTVSSLGLAFGSFLTALTYRLPRGESIKEGRSLCPTCKKQIQWYYNVPVVSYFLLSGKSACCGKKISIRYPLTELATLGVFLLTYFGMRQCWIGVWSDFALCSGLGSFGYLSLALYLFIAFCLIAVFIIDWEHQIIPDEFVFTMMTVIFLLLVFLLPSHIYLNLLVGFLTGLFFLLLNLVTGGKGMGLGDVKLVLPLGMILGWPYTLLWVFLSFVLGATVGVMLILLGKAHFGRHIPFGPYLVVSFFVILFAGHLMLPYFPLLLY